MIQQKAYGKINLALHIRGTRDDCYHDIDTVFQSIGIYDTITLEEAPDVQLTCSRPELPCDKTNLAAKAVAALMPYNKKNKGVHIHIEKKIPIAAGLAGGSTDCAAVLKGMNRLWDLGLCQEELMTIGRTLGADVPFCLLGGTARGTGRGDELTPLQDVPVWPVIIVHPHLQVSTADAYRLYDTRADLKHVDIDAMVAAVERESLDEVIAAQGNTFEELVIPQHTHIERCKDALEMYDLKPLMTGSGPTIFALVPPTVGVGEVSAMVRSVIDRTDVIVVKTIKRGSMQ